MYNNREYVLIDTAGLRRKNKIKEELERFMIIRTVSAVERADVVVFLVFPQSQFLVGRHPPL